MFFYNNFKEKNVSYLGVILGSFVFLTAVFGTSVHHVSSTTLAVLFLASLAYVGKWRSAWLSLSTIEKNLLIGFSLLTVAGFAAYYNTDDNYDYVKQMGRYLRFSAAIPVYLLLRHARVDLYKYLIVGVIISGPAFFAFAFYSWNINPNLRASSGYNPILYGDAAIMNAGIMAAWLLTCKKSVFIKVIVGVSILCALYAAVMSGARGAWIALPAYIVVLSYYSIKSGVIKFRYIALVTTVIILLIAVIPEKNIIVQRYDLAVTQAEQYAEGGNVATSVGIRLTMWAIAIDVWKEYPLLGTGLGDFDDELRELKNKEKYPKAKIFGDSHNVYFQTLATTGLIGFLAFIMATIIMPLRFLSGSRDRINSKKLAGVIVIVSFAVFGLTWSWIMRSPFIAIYLIYISVLMSSLKINDEKGI